MTKTISLVIVITALGAGMFIAGCTKEHDQASNENKSSVTKTQSGERKIKYYKSTMTPGEARQTPGKDSMGMDMVPVYEDEAAAVASQTIAIDPVTIQNMDIRTATV